MTLTIHDHVIVNAFAIENWGNSGSVFLHSLFDGHPNVLSMPYFHARGFFEIWESKLAGLPQHEIIPAFVDKMSSLHDLERVNRPAGLHRLGPNKDQCVLVDRDAFQSHLQEYFSATRIDRRTLFIAAHLAYAYTRGEQLARNLHILYPIHGRRLKHAQMFVDDFPVAKFIHTVRDPYNNAASSLKHARHDNQHYRANLTLGNLRGLICAISADGERYRRDRPHEPAMAADGRAAAIRLEDLHADPRKVMNALCDWLGVPWQDCLLHSTFGGLTWWNRPESPQSSGFNGANLGRNVDSVFSPLDRLRIAAITEPKARAWGYRRRPDARPLAILRDLVFLATLPIPWRNEARSRVSALRACRLLKRLAPMFPSALHAEIDRQLRRERIRFRYIRLNWATQKVHVARTDEERPNAVQCVLILFKDDENDSYQGRICEGDNLPGSQPGLDHVVVLFADELGDPTGHRPVPLTWATLKAFAGLLLSIGDYAQIRYWTLRAFVQTRIDHGLEAPLLSLDAPNVDFPRRRDEVLIANLETAPARSMANIS